MNLLRRATAKPILGFPITMAWAGSELRAARRCCALVLEEESAARSKVTLWLIPWESNPWPSNNNRHALLFELVAGCESPFYFWWLKHCGALVMLSSLSFSQTDSPRCMVVTLVDSHVCSPLFLVETPTTPASLRVDLMGSFGAVLPLIMTAMACTRSVPRRTVSASQSLFWPRK